MSERETASNTVQRSTQPFKLTLTRGQRGGYGWRIEVQAESRDELLHHVDLIDAYLRGKYLEGQMRSAFEANPHERIMQAINNVRKAGGKEPFRA